MFKIHSSYWNSYTKSFIVYVDLGTYLILDGKDKMRIDKETNNSILEVFSGDVIQFGQGMYNIFCIE